MKNKFFYCFFCIPLLLSITTCKTTTKTNDVSKVKTSTATIADSKPHTKLIHMVKGACHGTCPIYKLTIYKDGTCHFNGKRFCDKLGAHKAQLSDRELNILQQKIALLDMESYPTRIESMIPDFPSTEITFYEADVEKSVWWRSGAPDELNEMSVILDKFRQSLAWNFDTDAPLPPGTIEHQMLVQLNEGVASSDFAKRFSAYNLIPKKDLVPGQNYWLFEFDIKKISGVEMLNILTKSEQVRNVEFNREVEQRH